MKDTRKFTKKIKEIAKDYCLKTKIHASNVGNSWLHEKCRVAIQKRNEIRKNYLLEKKNI